MNLCGTPVCVVLQGMYTAVFRRPACDFLPQTPLQAPGNYDMLMLEQKGNMALVRHRKSPGRRFMDTSILIRCHGLRRI